MSEKHEPSRKILCVDDDKDTCELIAALLVFHNYQVEFATTAAEGLEKARQNSYKVILLDTYLPDGDGIELCKRIREFDAETPILFYTGGGAGRAPAGGIGSRGARLPC